MGPRMVYRPNCSVGWLRGTTIYGQPHIATNTYHLFLIRTFAIAQCLNPWFARIVCLGATNCFCGSVKGRMYRSGKSRRLPSGGDTRMIIHFKLKCKCVSMSSSGYTILYLASTIGLYEYLYHLEWHGHIQSTLFSFTNGFMSQLFWINWFLDYTNPLLIILISAGVLITCASCTSKSEALRWSLVIHVTLQKIIKFI